MENWGERVVETVPGGWGGELAYINMDLENKIWIKKFITHEFFSRLISSAEKMTWKQKTACNNLHFQRY